MITNVKVNERVEYIYYKGKFIKKIYHVKKKVNNGQ